jgi:hypothetical protein
MLRSCSKRIVAATASAPGDVHTSRLERSWRGAGRAERADDLIA